MPYDVQKSGKRWAILRKDTGRVVGHSTSKKKAEASVRARYVNEPKSMSEFVHGIASKVLGAPLGNQNAAKDYAGVDEFKSENGRLIIWDKSKYTPNNEPSIQEWVVNEASRGKGEGSQLLKRAAKKYPNLVGQASNKNSLKVLYDNGFRPYDSKDSSHAETLSLFNENGGSLLMQNTNVGK